MKIVIFKPFSGEFCIGKLNESKNEIENVIILQPVPTQEGIKLSLMPFFAPFSETKEVFISLDKVVTFIEAPEELKKAYLQVTSNIVIAKNDKEVKKVASFVGFASPKS